MTGNSHEKQETEAAENSCLGFLVAVKPVFEKTSPTKESLRCQELGPAFRSAKAALFAVTATPKVPAAGLFNPLCAACDIDIVNESFIMAISVTAETRFLDSIVDCDIMKTYRSAF